MSEIDSVMQQWIQRADIDIRAAEVLLDYKTDNFCDVVCFHCQQCIEKLLKASLIAIGRKPPKIHDLGQLALLIIEIKADLQLNPSEFDILTDFSTEGRYPGSSMEREEAEEILRLTRKLREQLLQIIQQQP